MTYWGEPSGWSSDEPAARNLASPADPEQQVDYEVPGCCGEGYDVEAARIRHAALLGGEGEHVDQGYGRYLEQPSEAEDSSGQAVGGLFDVSVDQANVDEYQQDHERDYRADEPQSVLLLSSQVGAARHFPRSAPPTKLGSPHEHLRASLLDQYTRKPPCCSWLCSPSLSSLSRRAPF